MTTVDPGHGQFDLWRDSAAADPAQARALADLLEPRARHPDQVAARAAYLELAGVAAGMRVLDVGCGSGVVARDVARRVGPAGRVVGLDPSPALLAVAAELDARDEVAEAVELRQGDARALPFPDATFDVVLAVTTLAHVPEAERAIPELVRAAIALQAGIISEDEQRGWLAALHAEQAAGRFLGGQTHLFVWGTRPP